ncbi:threonine/serine exporter ThrE family protein [Nocardia sp. NPDC051570]|uniref:threonine/serine exporter ThrE family protein n=1 Tax=Nocardia sp. NPDC051570 TaxID=3364324 RepID=UPI0037B4A49B
MSDEVQTQPIQVLPPPGRQTRIRQAVGRVVDRLVAQRQATVDALVPAPTPLKPVDLTDDARVTQVLELAECVGDVVLASGSSVMDTLNHVEFIASTYGLSHCDIDVTYNAIRISADRGSSLPPASTMRVVHHRSLDFTRLAAVDRLTRRIRREVVAPEDAQAALDTITGAPHPYNRWVATFGWSLLAAAIGFLVGGGILVAVVSSIATALIDRTNRALNRRGLPFFFQAMAGGAIATAPAIALATFAGSVEANPSLIVAAGITVLLSGLQLVGAVEDAITGAPITAAARMLEVFMMTGGIIAGVALALRAAEMLHAVSPAIDMYSSTDITNLPLKVIAGAVASLAFALACYAEQRALAAAGLSGAAATVCYLFTQHAGFGPVVSSGVAATVVGLAGGLMARRALTPPLVVAMAGITPLLPGMKVYRGLSALLDNQLLMGLSQLFAAFAVGCALAAGVTLGEWVARFLRRPRILLRFQGIRRPVLAGDR